MLPNRAFFSTLLWSGAFCLMTALVLRLVCFRPALQDTLSSDSLNVNLPLFVCTGLSALALIFWFIGAPDPRFGIGFLICFGASVAILLMTFRRRVPESFTLRTLGRVAACFLSVGVLINFAAIVAQGKTPTLAWRHLPVPLLREVQTLGGLQIKVPLSGDQCWEEEAVCVPTVQPLLTGGVFLGRQSYTLQPQRQIQPVRLIQPELKREELSVELGEGVWGDEMIQHNGVTYAVRWLQKETTFYVKAPNRTDNANISLDLSSLLPRKVWVLQEGKAIFRPQGVSGNFWTTHGADHLEFRVQLLRGSNKFSLALDGDPTELSPGRSAYALLIRDIRVTTEPQ